MVEDASGAGVTDLLVQVRGRGDAYYDSRFVMPAPQLTRAWEHHGRFDPLEMVIAQAHEHGIRVHAWLNVYLVWGKGTPPDGHVVSTNPEWVAVNRSNIPMSEVSFRRLLRAQTEGVYLEPGNRRVMKDFLRIVDELLSGYSLDGIHLDYVRYPEMDVGYSSAMRAGFRRRTGVDPLEFQANEAALIEEHGEAGFMALQRKWRKFKADQVTAMVFNLRKLIRQRQSDVLLSAAVKPDPESALDRNGQDWVRWVNEGLVDFVAPMMYSTSRTTVRRQAELLVRLVPQERVWAGIAVYNQSLDSAADKIRTVRRAGIQGVSIFSYNSIPGGARSLGQLNQVR